MCLIWQTSLIIRAPRRKEIYLWPKLLVYSKGEYQYVSVSCLQVILFLQITHTMCAGAAEQN